MEITLLQLFQITTNVRHPQLQLYNREDDKGKLNIPQEINTSTQKHLKYACFGDEFRHENISEAILAHSMEENFLHRRMFTNWQVL